MGKYIIICLLAAAVSLFVWRENYKYTADIAPAALLLPSWSGPQFGGTLTVTADGYDMRVTPYREYTISGLVMKNAKTRVFFDTKAAVRQQHPATVTLAFGENLRAGAYKTVTRGAGKFTWPPESGFSCGLLQDIAIVTPDKAAATLVKSLHPGDQVTLTGLSATEINFSKKGQPKVTCDASFSSAPNGSLLYIPAVSGVKILRRGSRTAHTIFLFSLCLSGVLLLGYLKNK